MNIRPLHDQVVVRRKDAESKSAGGIVIPDTASEKPMIGEVVAVGNGKIMEDGERQPLDVKTGDQVLFGKHAGTEIKVEDEKLLMMREDDLLAIVEN